MSQSHPYRALGILAIVLTLILLALTGAFLLVEASWEQYREHFTGQAAFVAGSIGTEFIPLPVLEVISDLDPDGFPSSTTNSVTGAWTGGWIERYGFLENRGPEETIPPREAALRELLRDEVRKKLPIGFSVSNLRPSTPDPSPVAFIGIACAGCHSTRLPDRGASGKLIYGAGNASLDLIGFFEAFRSLLIKQDFRDDVAADQKADRSVTEGPDLDPSVDPHAYNYVLTLTSVEQARARHNPPLRPLSPAERGMIAFWIYAFRQAALGNLKKYDLPATPEQLRSPAFNRVGPGRTQPFVTLVNAVLDLPARNNFGFSKIPAVFREGDRTWAQFDGSVRDHHTRSGLAAMTAGGSVHNLSGLGVGDHIIEAANYTRTALIGPRWSQIFGKPPGILRPQTRQTPRPPSLTAPSAGAAAPTENTVPPAMVGQTQPGRADG